MKKLLSGILSATMVAGMSVSAFAYVPEKQNDRAASDDDYTLSDKVYIYDDSKKTKEFTGDSVDGGDKLYYPILVNGDALDKDGLNASDYYYANKFSEIDDLKVRISSRVGGKYTSSDAKIVKKDLNISKTTGVEEGVAEVFSVKNTTTITKAIGPVGADKSGELTLGIKGGNVKATITDLTTFGGTAADVAGLFNGKTIAIDGVNFKISSVADVMTFTSQSKSADKVVDGTDKVAINLTKNVVAGTSSKSGVQAVLNTGDNLDITAGTVGKKEVIAVTPAQESFKATNTATITAATAGTETGTLVLAVAGKGTLEVANVDLKNTDLSTADKVAGLFTSKTITIDGVEFDIAVVNAEMTFTAKTADADKVVEGTDKISITIKETGKTAVIATNTDIATVEIKKGAKEVKGVTPVKEEFSLKNTATVTKATGDLTSGDGELTLGIKDGAVKVAVADLSAKDLTAVDVAQAFNGKTITIGGVVFDISTVGGSDVLTFKAKTADDDKVTDATDKATITLSKNAVVSNTVVNGSQAVINSTESTTVVGGTVGKAAKSGVIEKLGSVYCVEVGIGDYFGNTEKEVEFDISLRTRTKQYDSDNSNRKNPNMSFTLGNDADDILENGVLRYGLKKVKFNKNGDLDIKIDNNTKNVKLDEAKVNGSVYDVSNIFIEADNVDFTFDVKASDQDNLYLAVDDKSNKSIIEDNDNADLHFINFPGKPEFDFTGTARFAVPDSDKKWYFYELDGKRVKETNAKYDNDTEEFVLRTRTLGSYVLSDKKLATTVNDKTTDKVVSNTSIDRGQSITGGTIAGGVQNTPNANNGKVVPTGALD